MKTYKDRGCLTVDPSGNWRLYTNTIPANSRAIGTVTSDTGGTGALVLLGATGLYAQVNAGCLRSLPQSKILAALSLPHNLED